MKPKTRHKAREFALQAIYQWQIAGQPLHEISQQFRDSQVQTAVKVDNEYFQELLTGVTQHAVALDDIMQPWLDRALKDLTPVEWAVLRIAIYELKYHLDVPYRVVINEALELSKKYGTEDGHKYVNGILDKAARELRAVEIQK